MMEHADLCGKCIVAIGGEVVTVTNSYGRDVALYHARDRCDRCGKERVVWSATYEPLPTFNSAQEAIEHWTRQAGLDL